MSFWNRLTTHPQQAEDPKLVRFLLGDTRVAIFFLIVRVYLGWQWLEAGRHKLFDPTWMETGTALQGYWTRAIAVPKPPARAAITYGWYRDFLQFMLDHSWYTWFAKLVAIGETLVGIALIMGLFVGLAAFFGGLMNFNFMLAGSSSTNPVLFGLAVLMILGWKVGGYIGIDHWLLPILGTPWKPGTLFVREARPAAPGTTGGGGKQPLAP